MKKRIFFAGAFALAMAAGAVLAPSVSDAAAMHGGGGGHGGGGHGGGGFHGGGFHGGGGGYHVAHNYHGGYRGGAGMAAAVMAAAAMEAAAMEAAVWRRRYGGYYAGGCGPMQVVLGLCGPYGY